MIRKIVSRCLLVVFCVSGAPLLAQAQGGLTLSVTPTLFNMTIEPGQTWQSTIRVINPNPFDIQVYANPVNFQASGEQGRGQFIPLLSDEQSDNVTLAEWINITSEPIRVASQETVEVPFFITVPREASPGGQYAAVLITTQPPDGQGASQVRTAQAVSALFFARIEGDVVESGLIRSFRASQYFATVPENEFELRFENRGTVHIQPQGEVRIYNMWGEQRGVIPINQRSQYGNVLPDSIRLFSFSWTGERSLVDIGRYRAVATLAYGSASRQSVSQTAYFWVIPVTGLLVTIGTLLGLGLIFMVLVKAYVRRMLTLAGVPPERLSQRELSSHSPHDINLSRRTVVSTDSRWKRFTAPIAEAWLDATAKLTGERDQRSRFRTLSQLIHEYRLVVLACVVLFVTSVLIGIFFSVVKSERAFEVIVSDVESSTTISSEDIRYEQMQTDPEDHLLDIDVSSLTPATTTYPIEIVNVSGYNGAAAELRLRLEEVGFEVSSISTDLNRTTQPRTVIVYDREVQDQALLFSRALNGALVSVRPDDVTALQPHITIYLGSELIQK